MGFPKEQIQAAHLRFCQGLHTGVPCDCGLANLSVIRWSRVSKRVVFFVGRIQFFGGKSCPVNRMPGTLGAVPSSRCDERASALHMMLMIGFGNAFRPCRVGMSLTGEPTSNIQMSGPVCGIRPHRTAGLSGRDTDYRRQSGAPVSVHVVQEKNDKLGDGWISL